MHWWVASMSCFGGGFVGSIFMDHFVVIWQQRIRAIDFYPYEGMYFLGDFDLSVPLVGQTWGP